MAEVERVAEHVVTSENRAEFMAKRLDLVKPLDKVVAPETKPETTPALEIPKLGDEAKAAEQPKEGAEPAKKEEHPIKERFSEMAAKRRAAEEREKAALERAENAEREAQELRAKVGAPTEQKQDELGAPPKREDFKSDDEYIDAKISYGVKKASIEKAVADEKARVEAETTRVLSSWQERLDKARDEIEDYDEKIDKASSVVFSNQVRDAILESPMGPRMLYYFAEHPDEAEKLKGLSALSAVRAIGRLEADLTPKEKEATSAPKKAEVKISQAPAPISPLKGASAPENLVDSDGKFKGSFKQYKQLRKEGKL